MCAGVQKLPSLTFHQKALNLFNAALVTPTYYVFFTSATIVTSAILFQGFKGTASTISTVIMGFLQICAGVVLLQLSKSAKDVPDAAVFKGDLDQVRTVAEQEEPEYEPRADTIRGGGAILRSISKARSEKQMMEAKKLQEELMQPIGEDEQVEFDGIRRRKTVGSLNNPERQGTVVRQKTIHPPLGMSYFPEDDSDDDNSYHPGFFQRLRSRGKSTSSSHTPAVGLTALPPSSTHGSLDGASNKSSYTKAMQTDTSYKPHETTIHFGNLPHPPHPQHDRQPSGDSLQPPRPPPHTAKRQFSFQNVFGRHRAESGGEASIKRPVSKGSRKGSRDGKNISTEEERLGLVKGDSRILLPIPSRDSRDPSPEKYSDNDDDWRMTRSPSPGISPGRGPSAPVQQGVRRVDTDFSEIDPYDEKEFEKSRQSSAFL
jgi:hypothetical protein